MSNSRLEFLENNYYHIFNRGFEKNDIFKDEEDFEKFYKYILKELSVNKNIKIISYSFLPNHFHLIVHNIKTGFFISDFMRKVQVSYAMYFKRKYNNNQKIKNPVFEGRFKSKIILDEEFLFQCIAYVNFNPLKHKITNDINNYKWTSYHQIKSKKVLKHKDIVLSELEF